MVPPQLHCLKIKTLLLLEIQDNSSISGSASKNLSDESKAGQLPKWKTIIY